VDVLAAEKNVARLRRSTFALNHLLASPGRRSLVLANQLFQGSARSRTLLTASPRWYARNPKMGSAAQFSWICFAGALGTGARYLVGVWAARVLGTGFPYGTLFVNLVGSLLISIILQLAISTDWVGPTLRLTLTTGFMGGLTTYSSFNYETLKYFDERAWGLGMLNAVVTFVGCLTMGLIGLVVARKIVGS
jgi:CrcB protein